MATTLTEQVATLTAQLAEAQALTIEKEGKLVQHGLDLSAEKEALKAALNRVVPKEERKVLNDNLDEQVVLVVEQATKARDAKRECMQAQARERGARRELEECDDVMVAVGNFFNAKSKLETSVALSKLRTAYEVLAAEVEVEAEDDDEE